MKKASPGQKIVSLGQEVEFGLLLPAGLMLLFLAVFYTVEHSVLTQRKTTYLVMVIRAVSKPRHTPSA